MKSIILKKSVYILRTVNSPTPESPKCCLKGLRPLSNLPLDEAAIASAKVHSIVPIES